MNMMNWWRWNHEIRRWQTDDNFTNSDPRDFKYIRLDKLGSRLVQRTCSRCIWWRFSRGMMQDLSKTIWIQSFLDCIFIIRNGSKFIGCAWFFLYRMHISFESRAPIFMKLSSALTSDVTICHGLIAIRSVRLLLALIQLLKPQVISFSKTWTWAAISCTRKSDLLYKKFKNLGSLFEQLKPSKTWTWTSNFIVLEK